MPLMHEGRELSYHGLAMTDHTPLDNPAWHALNTSHRAMSRRNGLASRYATSVSPISALAELTPAAFDDLAALTDHDEAVGILATTSPDVPRGWELVSSRDLNQMIFVGAAKRPPASKHPITPLGRADVPEMLALTAATEPGPFRVDTITMGRYFGIRSTTGQLIAMAGERLNLDRFVEISAVCTDPAHRGQGLAGALVQFLVAQTLREGKTPFLHVIPENPAIRLYQTQGFQLRKTMRVTVLNRP